MGANDGLAKDGLSYRSDTFSMTWVTFIYTFGSAFWLVLVVILTINNLRAYPIIMKKQKDYELLHAENSEKVRSGSMSFSDSKRFRSDRDEWDKSAKNKRNRRKKRTGSKSAETATTVPADTGASTQATSRESAEPVRSRETKSIEGRFNYGILLYLLSPMKKRFYKSVCALTFGL
ncbi:hypothetical protein Q1695_013797 [Nippostrongylus brasiliensis]|nr:hypothetical protein Q1695_013797 [Nippostrongylus brasiliensis]